MNSIEMIIKKHWRVFTFIIVLLVLAFILWKYLSVLLPFLVGLILAFMLLPVVRWLEKHAPGLKKHPQTRRILIIIGIYIVGFIILAALVYYMITTINSSIALLWQTLPTFIPNVIDQVQSFLAKIRLDIPASLLAEYDSVIANAGVTIVDSLRSGLGKGLSVIWSSVSLILGFLSLPLIVFFLLKDWDHLRDGFFSSLPPWASEHAQNVAQVLEHVLGRYIRGQIIMSIIIGILVLVMMTSLRVTFAPALALWAALMENIPLLGVWLSITAGVIVVLATDPSKIIWILVGYIVIQQLENNLLVPRIQGKVMKMHPVFIILVSVMGAYLGGLVGFIIAVPLTATFIELFKYFKDAAHSEEQLPSSSKNNLR